MPDPVKTVQINGCQFPLGETVVNVDGETVRVSVNLDGHSEPVCQAVYSKHLEFIDEGCDGIDVRSTSFGHTYVADRQKWLRTLRQICPTFEFPPHWGMPSGPSISDEAPKPEPKHFASVPDTGFGEVPKAACDQSCRNYYWSRPRPDEFRANFNKTVVPKRRGSNEPKTSRQEKTFSVFFDTDKYNIDEADQNAIRSGLEGIKLPEASVSNAPPELIIAGHCDERASVEYNDILGQNRAYAVLGAVHAIHPKLLDAAKVSIVSYGETRPSGTGWDNDRRVDVTFGQTLIERGLFMLEGDVYLIDASGSMYERWSQVINFEFPVDARIYSFNSEWGVVNNLMTVPNFATPLWSSALTVIETMKKDETLVILSDGEDNKSTADAYDNVIARAVESGIHVNAIYVGNAAAHQSLLRTLAEKTGGAYFFLAE